MPRLALALLALAALIPGAARAQDAGAAADDSLRARYLLPLPATFRVAPLRPRSSPSMGANSPIAFGGRTGDVFAGASATARARQVEAVDGSYGVGFSLGDPGRYLSLDVTVISFSSFRSGFWKRGGVDLQLSRDLPAGFAIAAGWETAVHWGKTDGGSSKYAVVSKWLQLRDDTKAFSAVMLSAGVGTGRFIFVDLARDSTPARANVFGSVAVRVAPPLSLIADWTGEDLTAMASVAPFKRFPLSLSAGFADITGRVGESPRLVASGGVAFNLGEIF